MGENVGENVFESLNYIRENGKMGENVGENVFESLNYIRENGKMGENVGSYCKRAMILVSPYFKNATCSSLLVKRQVLFRNCT